MLFLLYSWAIIRSLTIRTIPNHPTFWASVNADIRQPNLELPQVRRLTAMEFSAELV